MNNIKDKRLTMNSSSGITLVALAITIIVMMIIATISIYEGTKVIKEAKVQTLETNMLAIKAKAKTYVEEVEAATWALTEGKEQIRKDFFTGEIDANGYGMEDVTIEEGIKQQLSDELKTDTVESYSITENTLKKMGLDEVTEDLKDAQYIMVYDKNNLNSMDIIYTAGIEYEGTKYYTLSALQAAHDD